jgi:hypothetical protein
MVKVWFSRCPPQNRSNRENQKALGVLPKGILTPSLIEIAPAATKRALLTDDDDECHVFAIAHQRWAKNKIQFTKCKNKGLSILLKPG